MASVTVAAGLALRGLAESLDMEMIKSGPQRSRGRVYLLAAGETKRESWINVAAEVLPESTVLSVGSKIGWTIEDAGHPTNADSIVRKSLARRSGALTRVPEITIRSGAARQSKETLHQEEFTLFCVFVESV